MQTLVRAFKNGSREQFRIPEASIRILVVDDDTAMLQWIRSQLESRGFHVSDALSGEYALKLYKQSAFDFILTDYFFVPGERIKNGLQLVDAILSMNPAQPIAIHTSEKRLKHSVPVLHKPYAISQLLRLLRDHF